MYCTPQQLFACQQKSVKILLYIQSSKRDMFAYLTCRAFDDACWVILTNTFGFSWRLTILAVCSCGTTSQANARFVIDNSFCGCPGLRWFDHNQWSVQLLNKTCCDFCTLRLGFSVLDSF